jgi:hypothetical protein
MPQTTDSTEAALSPAKLSGPPLLRQHRQEPGIREGPTEARAWAAGTAQSVASDWDNPEDALYSVWPSPRWRLACSWSAVSWTLDLRPQIQGKCKSPPNLDHDGIWQRAESALKPHGWEGTQTLHIRHRVLFKEGQAS